MKPKFIIISILVVLSIIILVQNTQIVEFQILFWKIAMSRIIMLIFSMLVGFIIGYIIAKTVGKKL